MMPDSTIKQRVLEEIRWDPIVDETHIGVTTSDGSVALIGHVSSFPEKYAACEAAKRVKGVKAVADEIAVNLPTEIRLDDGRIAERIARILEWSVSVPNSSVKARVQDGFVTLTGEVDWQHQRSQISDHVRHVAGVRGLTNQLTLKPRATSADVRKEIKDALFRNTEREVRQINVTVSGDTVTLSGSVNALYQRDLVESAAWSAPGVRQVIDHICVS